MGGDLDTPPAVFTSFAVDAADNSTYTLKLTDVVNRVDYLADGYDTDDVSISDSANGSSSTLANFDQNPINDGTNAVCSSGGNVTFQQVNYFALFHSNWKQSIYHGIFEPFPTSPWCPIIWPWSDAKTTSVLSSSPRSSSPSNSRPSC